MTNKMWGGRFTAAPDAAFNAYHSSIGFDCRLWRYDIQGSIAHATMLGERGIISNEDSASIVEGLKQIENEIETGALPFDHGAEDIHMFIEAELTRRIGDAGRRLHTGRSRNDQVALDFRMFIKDACGEATDLLTKFIDVLCGLSEKHAAAPMPGYTHLQRAQPVTLGHHLMAWAQMLCRDITRFRAAQATSDVMPLGSGALAGTTYNLDRHRVAELLSFSKITPNSLDAVADRDFACDFVYACAMCMVHLSRICEELILWSSAEFGFITISDGYATGSSMMPQKKNPDAAELTRGKTGRVCGSLVTLLTILKGLPLAYNKDMQEDKEAAFDACDTITGALSVMAPMLQASTFHTEKMRQAALDGFANATDLADYLVGRGVPFREAHEAAGRAVRHCIEQKITLLELSPDDYTAFHEKFDNGVYNAISLDTCVAGRSLPGGPAPESVLAQVAAVREALRTEQPDMI